MVIPKEAVNGLDLIWFSDLVISGGGTMNREAAALGVPVYSIFRGKLGAVDRYLSANGRLVLITSVEEVATKICLTRWRRPLQPSNQSGAVLQSIVNSVMSILEHRQAGKTSGVKDQNRQSESNADISY